MAKNIGLAARACMEKNCSITAMVRKLETLYRLAFGQKRLLKGNA